MREVKCVRRRAWVAGEAAIALADLNACRNPENLVAGARIVRMGAVLVHAARLRLMERAGLLRLTPARV